MPSLARLSILEAHTGVKNSRSRASVTRPAVNGRGIIQKKKRPTSRLTTSTNRPSEFLNVERVKMALSRSNVSYDVGREVIKFIMSDCMSGYFFGSVCSRRVSLQNVGFDTGDPETMTVTRDVAGADDVTWPVQITITAPMTGVGNVEYKAMASNGTWFPMTLLEFPKLCHDIDQAVDELCVNIDDVRMLLKDDGPPTPQAGVNTPASSTQHVADQDLDGFNDVDS